MATGNEAQVRDEVSRNEQDIRDADTIAVLGRSRGVFATVLNSFSSGSILLTVSMPPVRFCNRPTPASSR